MLIDTHAHIQDKAFIEGAKLIIENSRNAGVSKIIAPGSNFKDSLKAVEIADNFDCVWVVCGVHPHDAKNASSEDLLKIEKLCLKPKVVGVGEIGLDFHYNFSEPDIQREIFIYHLKMAKLIKKPVVIHSRESQPELIEILKKEKYYNGAIHCFSGNQAEADILLDMGFYLGFTGVITFPKSEALREVVKNTPMDRILSETDSPYLAPLPYRGKRNEPAYVSEVVKKIAEIKDISFNETAKVISNNTKKLFGI